VSLLPLARRVAIFTPLAALVSRPARAETTSSLPLAALNPAAPLSGDTATVAAQRLPIWQSGQWRATSQGDLAAAYINKIPSFRQLAGEAETATRTVAEELRERVAFTQFLTGARSPGEAIAAAVDHVWRNNGASGGEVLLPPGRAISVVAPIPARPGVTVRGPRLIEVPEWAAPGIGLFDVDGTEDFTLTDLLMSLGKRCSPASIRGGASGFSARGIRVHRGRTFWFERGGRARLSDIIYRGGTGVIGGGSRDGDRMEDVVATNIQAYDMDAEPIDLNFNVDGFSLTNFTFRHGSLRERGEMIDIGGGYCRNITIAHGLIDCGGAAHATTGIKVKLGTRNLRILGVDIVNGNPGRSVGIHLAQVDGVTIEATNVDSTFARGLFSEPAASDVRWRGGRCDSLVRVNGGSDIDLDIVHDGGGTDSPRAAVGIGFGARRAVIRGSVRNRPASAAVVLGGGRGGASDCGAEGLAVQRTLRGVMVAGGCERPRLRDLEMQEIGREAVFLSEGCRNAEIRSLTAVNFSTEGPGKHAALRISAGCHGSRVRDVLARDTGEGDTRNGGPAIAVAGPSKGLVVDGVIGDNLPARTATGLEQLAESSVRSVVTLD
jgi:hypothetical protein